MPCGKSRAGSFRVIFSDHYALFFRVLTWGLVFFPPLLFEPQKSRIFGLFYWAVSSIERNELAISIPVAPALQGSWPSPSQSSLRRGWEAAGLGGWVWGLGQELAPERIVPFNIGEMGAVLVEEAGG